MKIVTIALIIFFASFLYADAKRKGYAKQVQNQLVELLNHKEFASFEKQLKDAEEHGYIQEYNAKTRHLHMKAMNHDIHSLFYTLYLDISLFLSNILLIV